MKVSVSLPDDDIRLVDKYAADHGLSRSAAIQKAIQGLRDASLAAEYEQAYDEWSGAGEADLWAVTAADGLGAP